MFWRTVAAGVEISVRLTPKGGADRIDGPEQAADGRTHLKARMRAVPEKGEANKSLEKLVAKWVGVPASTVAVAAGATSRVKTIRIAGDPAELTARLDRVSGEEGWKG